MRHLSATDAALIHGETPEWHLHVTTLVKLDPATMPLGYRFADFRKDLAVRLRSVPRFRQKVVELPFGLDRPIWADAGGFDPRRHIHRIEVPAPGGDTELFALAGKLAAAKLDRGRPLWECWLLEDRHSNGLALLIKNHHVLFDGVGGLEAMKALFDLSAAGPENLPPAAKDTGDKAPGGAELLARTILRAVSTHPLETARVAGQIVRRTIPTAQLLASEHRPLFGLDAPTNPFGGQITPERSFAAVSLPMAPIKEVRSQAGVTINDVLLAVVGGSLREYLLKRSALPEASLVANVAASTRTEQDGPDAGNRFGVLLARLGTHLDDPVARLHLVARETQKAKRSARELDRHGELDLSAAAPPMLVSALSRAYTTLGLQDRIKVIGNVGVSNVPGPRVQLYVCGARVRGIYVMGPLMLNSLINFTAVSRHDQFDVGVVSTPTVVPDVAELTTGLSTALRELRSALGRPATPTSRGDTRPQPKRGVAGGNSGAGRGHE
jgi:WS/DGAT/MGAT family acyltransferase